MPAARVAILTAMVQEMRPVVRAFGLHRHDLGDIAAFRGEHDGVEVVAAVTEMGTVAARHVTSALLDRHDVERVLMVGIAGGVDPTLALGALVVPEVVVDDETGAQYRPTTGGGHTPGGALLTTNKLYNQPDDLHRLAERGIVAVDMETAAVGAVCDERGVGWSVFRAISDRAGDPATDASVVGMSHPDGTADVPAVVRYLVRHPGRVPHLARLARGMRLATRTAADAAVRAVAEL